MVCSTIYALDCIAQCHPDKIPTLNEPQEAYSIFYAYIGGIFLDYGDDGPLREIVQTWIELLGSDTESSQHAPKKIKTEFMESQIVPPPTMTTARVQTQPLSNPLTPSQPDSPFLKSFNEAAAKRGAIVDYPATEGTGNEGRWIVQCVVNGITKGTASGASKKIAQDLAARRAFDALGWA
ncbi:hypothetical protein GGX14DRAFT_556454 [Mycena pura]|uniref:DRBM domain-containing protein n=1 Tax=Mycena pura TaxID=153505 RepID=A0AAD6YPQ6_9AGAR|nr:hypothetical protein GGX14DRAFT_556454 [Mycena pura]